MWLCSYHELQASGDRQVCELQAMLKIANFEKERASLANQETVSQLRQSQLDREKLQKKVRLVVWWIDHSIQIISHVFVAFMTDSPSA